MDRRRFEVLDRLIQGGWTDVKQEDIPDDVMEAAEEGRPLPTLGPCRETRFSIPIWDPPAIPGKRIRPPAKKAEHPRILTQEQRDRRNARKRAQWFYKYGPRERPKQQENQNECRDALLRA
jgi:hypothetical protein